MKLNNTQIQTAFKLLNHHLSARKSGEIRLVVCGGSALICTEMATRTTKDVDIVALLNSNGALADPEPLPEELLDAASKVAEELNLPPDWVNNGPSSGPGGLFRMGLPAGLADRVMMRSFGEYLTVCFISRIDQVFLKLYAAVDCGGYHTEDLLSLNPTENELLEAARWTMTHDVSDGFRMVMTSFLMERGYESVAEKI